ncbi:EPN [Mytilus edulis]|uniref:EPN n=1 Tax=Mytilus edulis TaxID=6550 RepID=A0A8S3RSP9_MYTED|nr:EPN [Mytilus edulis]
MPPIRRTVKNVIHNYSEAQVKVREATSNDPWGPSSTLMSEIADLTYNVVAFTEIMQMIWKRLNDHGKNWRHVYKSLMLLDYIIKTGSEKVAQQCKENIFAIQTLRDFQYIESNQDKGINVREKAKQLVALLKDDQRLRNERAKALKAKERLALNAIGIGADDKVRYGRGSRICPPEQEEEVTLTHMEMGVKVVCTVMHVSS